MLHFKTELPLWLKQLQQNITNSLLALDTQATLKSDEWQRAEGGGGVSNVITNGSVFEKGGIMFSSVHGTAPNFLLHEIGIKHDDTATPLQFFATGLSIVIHPLNPLVSIIHMNIRYFELSNGINWFGGGIDLTPIYINDAEAKFFHQSLKTVCDKHNKNYYSKFKPWADDYFYIQHRKETRGIGGVFFDKLHADETATTEQILAFWKELGKTFAPVYTHIVKQKMNVPYTQAHQNWQSIRRGRYVEFNLVYDRGTKFGLESNGRTESILVSLPKHAEWHYDYAPPVNSDEQKTQQKLIKNYDWINT